MPVDAECDRLHLIARLETYANRAEEQMRDMDRLGTHSADVIASCWLKVAQVWREAKAKIEDGVLAPKEG